MTNHEAGGIEVTEGGDKERAEFEALLAAQNEEKASKAFEADLKNKGDLH